MPQIACRRKSGGVGSPGFKDSRFVGLVFSEGSMVSESYSSGFSGVELRLIRVLCPRVGVRLSSGETLNPKPAGTQGTVC